ncbi:MAG: uridine kinase [Bdellovibrio sp.]|nr:MAG: uridine kinase [Bdellovibrio sp.]
MWVFGIAGGSASGKTTFARRLLEKLKEYHVKVHLLYQDSYYKDHSQEFDFDGGRVNFDHPEAIDFALMDQHLTQLSQGHPVPVPIYDFKTHSRKEGVEWLSPPDVLLIDGILILHEEKVRKHLHYSVFIKTGSEERLKRRLKRDVEERGRTQEGVLRQFYSQVEPMHQQFVEPSCQFANEIFSGEEDFSACIDKVAHFIISQPIGI